MEEKEIRALFDEKTAEMGLNLNEAQRDAFDTYYELLTEWNQKMNLTSITDRQEVYVKHFEDSLAVVRAFDFYEADTLIDVGTGGGFPGIPLKIAFPHLKITLMDSLQKRILFLNEVIDRLDLKDVQTVHSRAEDAARQDGYRECFDVCVSRAVANLSTLCEYCLPFVKTSGVFISYKSGDYEKELAESLNAIKKLSGNYENAEKFKLDFQGETLSRTFLIIRKTGKTPAAYPRRAGIPSRKPLH